MEQLYQALIGLAAAAITAVASYLGVTLKNIVEKHVSTKIKRDVARTVVEAVEQWQARCGVNPTGIVDTITWKTILGVAK